MEIAPLLAIAVTVVCSLALGAVAAAETALERASDVRIQALAARGDPRARRIAGSVEQPRTFLGPLTSARVLFSATIVSLGAYLGARAPVSPAAVLGIGVGSGVYVAFVQLTVGLIAARRPEQAALQLNQVVRLAGLLFALPFLLLSLPSRFAGRFLRVVVAPDSALDIVALVEREEAAGGVEEQERRMIRGVIALEDKTAREIMVPRIDIAAAEIESSVADIAAIVNERGFSRVPIYRDNIDDVVGIAYAKDLLRAVASGDRPRPLAGLLRSPVFIPESKRLDQLLTEMRATRTHMAIVVDEYGGTAGLVTIEDLLEEIVGEIEDEYDVTGPAMELISDDEVVLDAGMSTDVLHDLFGFEVDSEDFDTVGGLLIHRLGRLPSVGDEVAAGPVTMRVLSMSGRRVKRMRIARLAEEAEAAANGR